jgi:hypothetical protein
VVLAVHLFAAMPEAVYLQGGALDTFPSVHATWCVVDDHTFKASYM